MSAWCCFDDDPSPKPQFILFIAATEKAGASTVMRRAVTQVRRSATSGAQASSSSSTVPTIVDFETVNTVFDQRDDKKRRRLPFTLVDVGRPARAELLALSSSSHLEMVRGAGDSSLLQSSVSLPTSLRPRSASSVVSCTSSSSSAATVHFLLGKASGVVFVVDCAEKAHGSSVSDGCQQSLSAPQVSLFTALRSAMADAAARRHTSIPLFIAANKQDVASSICVRDVVACLGVKSSLWPSELPWTCQPCVAAHPMLVCPRGILEFFVCPRMDDAPICDLRSEQPPAQSTPMEARRRSGSDAELTQRLSSSAPGSPRASEAPISLRSVAVSLAADSELVPSRRRNYVPLDR